MRTYFWKLNKVKHSFVSAVFSLAKLSVNVKVEMRIKMKIGFQRPF